MLYFRYQKEVFGYRLGNRPEKMKKTGGNPLVKDVTQKTLESYNDIFADIMNVLIFDGQEVVKEDDLTDALPVSQYKFGGSVRSQERDTAKYWNNGKIRIAVVGLENQTAVDADMPLRVIGYDGAAYRDQLNRKDNGERNRYPVVTLVLYFGTDRRWKGSRSLRECLTVQKGMERFVSDYNINVIEVAYLEEEEIKKFRSDFRILADYCRQMRETGDYIPKEEEPDHPREVFEALAAVTDDDRYEKAYIEVTEERKGGKANMCEYIDRLEARGMAKGRAEGMAEGRAAGRAEGMAEGESSTLISLVRKGLITVDDALRESSDPENLKLQIEKMQ